MMNGGMCKCPHHIVDKVLACLAWVSAILFFWASWGNRMFWGFNANYWAWVVVILVLLSKTTKACGCCGWHGMMKDGMTKDGMKDDMKGHM